MKGIMFNTKHGLESAVLNGTKTRTWRADKKPRYEVGEVVAVKQCYKDVMNYMVYHTMRKPSIYTEQLMRNQNFTEYGRSNHNNNVYRSSPLLDCCDDRRE